jgi:predicted nucleotidyltransferase
MSIVPPDRDSIVARLAECRTELRSFGIESLDLFGSIARGEGCADSDVDLLVAFRGPVTSDQFFGLKFFLEDLLGRRIDLVTKAALPETLRPSIESELVNVA